MALSVYNSAAFSTASGLAVAGGATVSVRRESTGALAALYANRDAAGSPGLANPLTADSSGRFTFYAALVDEGYSVTVTSGAESFTVQNVLDLEPYRVIVASPEDYGAFGDGIRDDSDAFAAAFTALGASNFELRGRSGSTYLIGASGISISSKSNAKIIGCGAKLKVNAVATQSPSGLGSTVIFIDTCTKLEFSGWEIDGNSKATNVIGLKSNTECEVKGNRISTGGLSGMIFALGNTRCRYLDNECISGTGTTRGMWLGNYATGHMETDPEVAGNIVRSMGATGIVLSSDGGRCYGNHVSTSTAGSGIIFGGANGFQSNSLSIFGNVCRGQAAHGIQSDVVADSPVSIANIPHGITITGNICEQNGSSGIYAVLLYRSTISSNICRDNNADSTGADGGITIDDVDGLSVCGNTCYSSSASPTTQNHGIYVSADTGNIFVKNVSITGNVCYNNSTNGIYVNNVSTEAVDNVTITGNVCSSNGAYGIRVTESTVGTVNAVTVTGNTCKNNGTFDLGINILNAVFSDNIYTTHQEVEYWTFTDQDTTPSVKGRRNYRAANSVATSITAFDDGVDGQEIAIRATNGNTTIVHGGFLVNKGAVNATISSDGYISYRREGTVWREMYRSF